MPRSPGPELHNAAYVASRATIEKPVPQAKRAPTPAAANSEPPKPIEQGSKEDFQLAQSIAFLKGEPLKGQTPSVAQTKPAAKAN